MVTLPTPPPARGVFGEAMAAPTEEDIAKFWSALPSFIGGTLREQERVAKMAHCLGIPALERCLTIATEESRDIHIEYLLIGFYQNAIDTLMAENDRLAEDLEIADNG